LVGPKTQDALTLLSKVPASMRSWSIVTTPVHAYDVRGPSSAFSHQLLMVTRGSADVIANKEHVAVPSFVRIAVIIISSLTPATPSSRSRRATGNASSAPPPPSGSSPSASRPSAFTPGSKSRAARARCGIPCATSSNLNGSPPFPAKGSASISVKTRNGILKNCPASRSDCCMV